MNEIVPAPANEPDRVDGKVFVIRDTAYGEYLSYRVAQAERAQSFAFLAIGFALGFLAAAVYFVRTF